MQIHSWPVEPGLSDGPAKVFHSANYHFIFPFSPLTQHINNWRLFFSLTLHEIIISCVRLGNGVVGGWGGVARSFLHTVRLLGEVI